MGCVQKMQGSLRILLPPLNSPNSQRVRVASSSLPPMIPDASVLPVTDHYTSIYRGRSIDPWAEKTCVGDGSTVLLVRPPARWLPRGSPFHPTAAVKGAAGSIPHRIRLGSASADSSAPSARHHLAPHRRQFGLHIAAQISSDSAVAVARARHG